MKRWLLLISVLVLCFVGFIMLRHTGNPEVGDAVDELNGVEVFYNGSISNVSGRHLSEDGYNLGLKYQCVEFVKRYYYEHLNHKMPNSYGHAKDFFHKGLADGRKNRDRNLIQYVNGGGHAPEVDDILVFDGHSWNKYGHVAIISAVTDNELEIIQQNPGPLGSSREKLSLRLEDGKWTVEGSRVLGWLRKES